MSGVMWAALAAVALAGGWFGFWFGRIYECEKRRVESEVRDG